MKINWKVRLKNKTWLLAFLGAIAAFIYQIMGMLDIGGHEAIVIRSKKTVLLIPFEFAFRGLLASHAILLCTACIDIDKDRKSTRLNSSH